MSRKPQTATRELQLSEDNLNLQEQLSKLEVDSSTKERKIRELEAYVRRLEEGQRASEAENKLLAEHLARKEGGLTTGDDLPQLVEGIKSAYKGRLEAQAYSKVVDLLDAKKTLDNMRGDLNALSAQIGGLRGFDEGIVAGLRGFQSVIEGFAEAISALATRIDSKVAKDDALRAKQDAVLDALTEYLRRPP